MSEAEILAELATRTQMVWNYLQWWASISLAIIATGYLTSDRQLTMPMLVLLLGAYTMYSLMILLAVGAQTGFVVTSIDALLALDASGSLGPMGKYAIEEISGEAADFRAIVIRVTLAIVYLLTVAYPLYASYRSHRVKAA